MAQQLGVEPGEAKPGEQREAAEQYATFRSPGRTEHRRGDAQEHERAAPEGGEQDETGIVGASHGRRMTQSRRADWPFSDLSVRAAPRGPKMASATRFAASQWRP